MRLLNQTHYDPFFDHKGHLRYVSVSFLHGSVFPCVHMSEGSEIGFDLTDALLQMNQRFWCVSRDE